MAEKEAPAETENGSDATSGEGSTEEGDGSPQRRPARLGLATQAHLLNDVDTAAWLTHMGLWEGTESVLDVLRDELTAIHETAAWSDVWQHSGTWNPNGLETDATTAELLDSFLNELQGTFPEGPTAAAHGEAVAPVAVLADASAAAADPSTTSASPGAVLPGAPAGGPVVRAAGSATLDPTAAGHGVAVAPDAVLADASAAAAGRATTSAPPGAVLADALAGEQVAGETGDASLVATAPAEVFHTDGMTDPQRQRTLEDFGAARAKDAPIFDPPPMGDSRELVREDRPWYISAAFVKIFQTGEGDHWALRRGQTAREGSAGTCSPGHAPPPYPPYCQERHGDRAHLTGARRPHLL